MRALRHGHQQGHDLDRQQAVRGDRPSRLTPAAERLDDPWLRGLVLATSVQNSLVVTQVGDPDFAGLTQFMRKPGSSVLMTFSSDPHLGMTDGQFTGSAVVFPTTVTFGAPAHREPRNKPAVS